MSPWVSRLGWIGAIVAGLAQPPAILAQTLAQRVTDLHNGTLRLSFAARTGVCAGGSEGNISIVDAGSDGEWEGACSRQPVRVSLRVRDGAIESARTYVGGRWRSADAGTIELGVRPAGATAHELLTLVERSPTAATEALVTAAALADSAVIWPELLRLARRPELPLETRRRAVFWLGQAAGEAAGRGLDTLVAEPHTDLEIRKQAVFALSQRPAEEGVPALIRVARGNPHPEVRKAALFWLGQTDDPRALALFEELLR